MLLAVFSTEPRRTLETGILNLPKFFYRNLRYGAESPLYIEISLFF